MEWSWYDPNRDESTRWWTIDLRTGQPDGDFDGPLDGRHCLGESVLDDVEFVADAIATEFAFKGFTNDEVSALIMRRVVPASFRGGPSDAAELAKGSDDLWALVEECYLQALGRPPDDIERKWLHDHAIAAIRARVGGPPA